MNTSLLVTPKLKGRTNQACLMLADQQLITGTALIIVGYSKHCTITQYHFSTVSLLFWTSFITMQAAAVATGGLMVTRTSKLWRLVCTTVLFASLIAHGVVRQNRRFMVTERCGLSMQCLWATISTEDYSPRRITFICLRVLTDLWSYVAICSTLYPPKMDWPPVHMLASTASYLAVQPSRLYLRIQRRRLRKTATPTLAPLLWGLELLLLVPIVAVLAMQKYFFSLMLHMFRVWTYLTSITIWLFAGRSRAILEGRIGNEDTWGFGQILPMLLLALPILTLMDLLHRRLLSALTQLY